MIAYITGAPAAGKSTLCERLSLLPNVRHFPYSARLRDHISVRLGRTLSEADMRESSARLISPDDVKAVDAALATEIEDVRRVSGHLLVDSHPVTKEQFGFRVTPFSVAELNKLAFDRLVCLYAAPDVLATRIKDDPQGRPLPTEFELHIHAQLQMAVLAQYAVLSGRHCYLVDSDISREELGQQVAKLLKLTTD